MSYPGERLAAGFGVGIERPCEYRLLQGAPMSSSHGLPDMWVAHDWPERPLGYGAWLCCCRGCAMALAAQAERRPGMPIVIKSARDRFVVPAATVVGARWGGAFERLLRLPDDWIREVFVGPGADSRR